MEVDSDFLLKVAIHLISVIIIAVLWNKLDVRFNVIFTSGTIYNLMFCASYYWIPDRYTHLSFALAGFVILLNHFEAKLKWEKRIILIQLQFVVAIACVLVIWFLKTKTIDEVIFVLASILFMFVKTATVRFYIQ